MTSLAINGGHLDDQATQQMSEDEEEMSEFGGCDMELDDFEVNESPFHSSFNSAHMLWRLLFIYDPFKHDTPCLCMRSRILFYTIPATLATICHLGEAGFYCYAYFAMTDAHFSPWLYMAYGLHITSFAAQQIGTIWCCVTWMRNDNIRRLCHKIMRATGGRGILLIGRKERLLHKAVAWVFLGVQVIIILGLVFGDMGMQGIVLAKLVINGDPSMHVGGDAAMGALICILMIVIVCTLTWSALVIASSYVVFIAVFRSVYVAFHYFGDKLRRAGHRLDDERTLRRFLQKYRQMCAVVEEADEMTKPFITLIVTTCVTNIIMLSFFLLTPAKTPGAQKPRDMYGVVDADAEPTVSWNTIVNIAALLCQQLFIFIMVCTYTSITTEKTKVVSLLHAEPSLWCSDKPAVRELITMWQDRASQAPTITYLQLATVDRVFNFSTVTLITTYIFLLLSWPDDQKLICNCVNASLTTTPMPIL